MKIPFTIDEFLTVFERYNTGIWPAQIFIYLLVITVIVILFTSSPLKNSIISLVLFLLWLWMGIVYHLIYFSSINPAAFLFGALFIIQGLLFFYIGSYRKMFEFKFAVDAPGIIAIIFLLYALVGYPALAHMLCHVYPRTPTFGLPCPTTIYTFGILLFVQHRLKWYILLIPLLWSLIGFSAAFNLGIREDYALPIAGILGSLFLLFKKPVQSSIRVSMN